MTTKKRAPRKTATKKTATKKVQTKRRATKSTALAKRPVPLTLVTGGTGFLGAHLVRELVARGEQRVRVFASTAPAWLAELGVETVTGSITNADDVARAVEGVGSIYHLAGRVSRAREDAHLMCELHVDGTRVLCQAARAAGVRQMLLVSTSGTIAVTDSEEIIPDENWPAPLDIISRWPYYASKFYQERVALEHFTGAGLRLVIVNPSLLLGPGDERLSSTKVILDFLARKIMSVPTGGLSFVDARDVAAVLPVALERGAHGERFLLGAVNWSFAKFFERLERLTKVAAPRFSLPSRLAVTGAQALDTLYRHWQLAPPVKPDEIEQANYFWYLDATKAHTELGFNTRDLQETLQETVAYVREHFLGQGAFA
ncbi:MAG TPA: NAD-dependent epimerase/dehydratase family protein [Pyrinomonadaceae bacterium]|nr:NAD-dependent epimerase/dehydratase family protein [Pyrinomonadaceae bacterium]